MANLKVLPKISDTHESINQTKLMVSCAAWELQKRSDKHGNEQSHKNSTIKFQIETEGFRFTCWMVDVYEAQHVKYARRCSLCLILRQLHITSLWINVVYLPIFFTTASTTLTWWRYQIETSSVYWTFVRSPVNSPRGQRCGALMFYLIYAWTNGRVNNREAGVLGRHRSHCDVIVMEAIGILSAGK